MSDVGQQHFFQQRVLLLWGKLISYNRGGGVGGSSWLISHSQIEYISYVFIELQLVQSAISQCQCAPRPLCSRGGGGDAPLTTTPSMISAGYQRRKGSARSDRGSRKFRQEKGILQVVVATFQSRINTWEGYPS